MGPNVLVMFSSVTDPQPATLAHNLPQVKHTRPSGRGRFLFRLVSSGLRVLDDLPVGVGVAHVGGASAAARPRQEAKAVAERRGGGGVGGADGDDVRFVV